MARQRKRHQFQIVPMELLVHGNSVEIVAEVEFTISPDIPATGPTYSCGGYPAEGGEVEVVAVKIVADADARPRTYHEAPWLADLVLENVDLNALAENAEPDDDEPDDDRYERELESRESFHAAAAGGDFDD